MNWSTVAERLSHQLDENRRLEIASHLADANDNGESATPRDVASIALLVSRAKATQARRELPNIVAGLPVALLCLWTYGIVYSVHLQAWDLAEEIPSSDPTRALLRRLADQAWVVVIPLGIYVGWRVVQRFRTGPRLLPFLFLGSLIALVGQTFWSLWGPGADIGTNATNDGLSVGYYIDAVSIQTLAVASLAVFLPLTFAAADWMLRIRTRRREPSNKRPAQPSCCSPSPPPTVGHAVPIENAPSSDTWAVTAVALGGAAIIPIFSSIVAIPFVLATWMASSFSRTQKLLATASGLGTVLLFGLIILVAQQPGLVIYYLPVQLAVQIGVWIWMATTIARKPTSADLTKVSQNSDQFSAMTSR